MTARDDWTFTVLAVGGAEHIRARCVPLAEALSAEFPDHEGLPKPHDETSSPAHLAESFRAHTTFGLAESLVGIVVFLTGWGAKRLLDDVYDLKIRSHVREILGEADGAVPSAQRRKTAFVFTIWHDTLSRGVVVVAAGSSRAGLLDSETRVTAVHLEAAKTLARDPKNKPISLYVILDGAPQSPLFFDNVGEAYEFVVSTPWKLPASVDR